MKHRLVLAFVACVFMSGCEESVTISAPTPTAMTEEALGYYCQMGLMEHQGPKAQIHVSHLDQPLWFSQVRDAVAFTRLPEETAEVTAIYVSDMATAETWAHPGTENWIDANEAFFVLDSRKHGGMGAPEAVPFSTAEAAGSFIAEHGGKVVRFSEIPDAYVLAPVDVSAAASHTEEPSQ